MFIYGLIGSEFRHGTSQVNQAPAPAISPCRRPAQSHMHPKGSLLAKSNIRAVFTRHRGLLSPIFFGRCKYLTFSKHSGTSPAPGRAPNIAHSAKEGICLESTCNTPAFSLWLFLIKKGDSLYDCSFSPGRPLYLDGSPEIR